MPDSLVLAGQIELLGGGVASTNPLCPGAQFRLMKGWDGGAPQPTQDILASLVVDGERPFGYRSSDRTVTLPIVIIAPQGLGVDDARAVLAGAKELLLSTINAQTWQMTWTRSGGQPLVLECFRANPAAPVYDLMAERQYVSQITVSFLALPYGRSDTPQVVSFASPATPAPSPPPAPVLIDDYSSVSGAGWAQSDRHVIGPHSAYKAATGHDFADYSHTFAAKDLTGQQALTAWVGLGTGSYDSWNHWHHGPVAFTFTLTDSSARTLRFGCAPKLTASNSNEAPAWSVVTAAIPQGSLSFDYAHVTGYEVTASNFLSWSGMIMTTAVYLDHLQAVPVTTSAPASVRGAVYTLHGVAGTARAPLSLQFQQPEISAPVTKVLTGSGQWIPPPGVTSVQVECVGGGGAGSSLTASGPGGGGGGAEYAAEPAWAITSPVPIPYSCGAGGTAAGIGPQVVTFTQAGSASWQAPDGVTSILAECWGAGAGGAKWGGGGGGGEYAAQTLTVVPGNTYQLVVGAGGAGSTGHGGSAGGNSVFAGASATVTAHGGHTASDGGFSGGSGGSGSTNTTHHNGGAGGTSPNTGGGGGGSGGSTSAGNVGSSGSGSGGGAGATAVTGGGPGGNGSGSGSGQAPATGPGGGGGAGSSGGNGADGQVQITYTVAAGSPVDGAATTFSTGVTQVIANGGHSAALNSATGAAGGSGSSATVHFSGGAGFTSASGGGGGGSSAGSGGAGTAATSATGALPPAGGGKGGTGAAAGNNPGGGGFQPGGGGGGASSSGGTEPGGAGGDGQITLTYTATLAPFRTVLAHRPGPDSPPSLTPFVSTASSSDPPDGREYPVQSLVSGVNARFAGTYSVVAVAYAWAGSLTAQRTMSVTVHQYEYPTGPSVAESITKIVTPGTDPGNPFITLGELTLPQRDMAADNSSAFFTVGITSSNAGDRFLDILFLDTLGQTLLVNGTIPYVNLYADEPGSDRDQGRVLGSAFDRAQAVSVLDSAFPSGGPLTVQPGADCQLMVYSLEGAPALVASYAPRWFLDRLS